MPENDPKSRGPACPSDEEFLNAFLGRGRLAAKDALLTHVRACARCRLKFDSLLRVRTDVGGRWPLCTGAAPVMRRPLAWAAGAAAVLVVFLGGLYLFLRHEQVRVHRGVGARNLALIEPAGKLAAPPGVFIWTAVKGADGYVLELVDDELTRIARVRTPRPRFVLPDEDKAKLKRGRTYVWSVSAFDDFSRFLDSASRTFEIE